MTELAAIFGLLYFLLCVSLAATHALAAGRLTLIDWATLGMGGVYGAGWALVALVTDGGGNQEWEQWLLPFQSLYPIHTLCALVLLGSTWIGWQVSGRWIQRTVDPGTGPSPKDSSCVWTMWVLLIVAFAMQWLYTRAFGGFLGLLEYSASIRSSIFAIDNPLSFLQPFGGLALFSSYGFFGLWLSGNRRFGVLLGFVLSLAFSLYIQYSWLWRIGFLVYLTSFALGVWLFRRQRPLAVLFQGGLSLLFVVSGAYYVSLWLDIKSADGIGAFLGRELSFPFGSFFGQVASDSMPLRAMKDLVAAPLYLLPSSWWSGWGIEDVGQLNTALIMGASKGDQGVTAAVPLDLLTLGFLQGSVMGIAACGALFGALLRGVGRCVEGIKNPGVRALLEAYIALKVAVLGVFYAQPSLFMAGNFDLLIAIGAIFFFEKLGRVRLVHRGAKSLPRVLKGATA